MSRLQQNHFKKKTRDDRRKVTRSNQYSLYELELAAVVQNRAKTNSFCLMWGFLFCTFCSLLELGHSVVRCCYYRYFTQMTNGLLAVLQKQKQRITDYHLQNV